MPLKKAGRAWLRDDAMYASFAAVGHWLPSTTTFNYGKTYRIFRTHKITNSGSCPLERIKDLEEIHEDFLRAEIKNSRVPGAWIAALHIATLE